MASETEARYISGIGWVFEDGKNGNKLEQPLVCMGCGWPVNGFPHDYRRVSRLGLVPFHTGCLPENKLNGHHSQEPLPPFQE